MRIQALQGFGFGARGLGLGSWDLFCSCRSYPCAVQFEVYTDRPVKPPAKGQNKSLVPCGGWCLASVAAGSSLDSGVFFWVGCLAEPGLRTTCLH